MGKARDAGQGILITLVGILLLVTVGFVIGLVVGVVSEEPELVVGHVAGRSTEVDWSLPVEETPVRPVSEEDSWPAAAQVDSVVETEVAAVEVGTVTDSPEALPPVSARGALDPSFAIQVGAFGEESPAKGMAERLRKAGYSVMLLPPTEDHRWRVRVGPIAGKSVADELARRLKVEEGLPTWVIAEKRS